MKKVIISLILAVILSLTLASPAFAGPPEDAGKGTVLNDGLWNADEHLQDIFYALLAKGKYNWGLLNGWCKVSWLLQPSAGPPPLW